MNYWLALVSRSFEAGEKDPLYVVEHIEDLTEHVPTNKENLFDLIKKGKADWSYINHRFATVMLRCRFNQARDLTGYVFTADNTITFEDFQKLADKNSRGFYELLQKKGQKI